MWELWSPGNENGPARCPTTKPSRFLGPAPRVMSYGQGGEVRPSRPAEITPFVHDRKDVLCVEDYDGLSFLPLCGSVHPRPFRSVRARYRALALLLVIPFSPAPADLVF